MCYLLVKYDFDWALFIQGMLRAASTQYNDPTFVDRVALPEHRIAALQQTDLLIQAALAPISRIRSPTSSVTADSTAVYLGHDATTTNTNNDAAAAAAAETNGGTTATPPAPFKLFTVPLSAAYVVDDTGAGFWYGSDDITPQLQTYVAPTPAQHEWDTWEDFTLYDPTQSGESWTSTGTIEINNTLSNQQPGGAFRIPFGGTNATTVLQIAAISSAAGGNG